MRLISLRSPLGPALLASLAMLAACDKPKDRSGADQGGPLGASGATSVGGPAPGAAAQPVLRVTTTDPLPDAPKWAAPLIGKTLKDHFPVQITSCVGNTDVVGLRYQGASPGVRIDGWGWDPAAKAPVPRVILVEDGGKIVGAGEAGQPRPDVVAARRDITSPTTGWQAFTTQTTGGVYAFGLIGDGKTACRLGHIVL